MYGKNNALNKKMTQSLAGLRASRCHDYSQTPSAMSSQSDLGAETWRHWEVYAPLGLFGLCERPWEQQRLFFCLVSLWSIWFLLLLSYLCIFAHQLQAAALQRMNLTSQKDMTRKQRTPIRYTIMFVVAQIKTQKQILVAAQIRVRMLMTAARLLLIVEQKH